MELSRTPRCYDSSATAEEGCSSVSAWCIATVALDWYVTPKIHFVQQNPHYLLAQIKPQAVQNVTTQRKSREESRRDMFIAQINLNLRTKQIQALIPVQENPSFLPGYKSYLQTLAIKCSSNSRAASVKLSFRWLPGALEESAYPRWSD